MVTKSAACSRRRQFFGTHPTTGYGDGRNQPAQELATNELCTRDAFPACKMTFHVLKQSGLWAGTQFPICARSLRRSVRRRRTHVSQELWTLVAFSDAPRDRQRFSRSAGTYT